MEGPSVEILASCSTIPRPEQIPAMGRAGPTSPQMPQDQGGHEGPRSGCQGTAGSKGAWPPTPLGPWRLSPWFACAHSLPTPSMHMLPRPALFPPPPRPELEVPKGSSGPESCCWSTAPPHP
uniref:Uncharacterized protein n=1 Tax=Rousettus aegyptiacus TaxID=9407 RepID=A0A7J8FIF5_ROUAE|nr:hypothetical protein HJG63_011917 [Rousettus aegyptiacus]